MCKRKRRNALNALLLFALGVFLVSGSKGNAESYDSSLVAKRGEDTAVLLDSQGAKDYYEKIGTKVTEGTVSGVFTDTSFPAEDAWDQYQYALYTGVQKHGDAFTVFLHVLTVYDGDAEMTGLAWLEDEPGEVQDYQIDGYLFHTDDVVEKGKLVYVSGYTARVSEAEVDIETLERYRYEQTLDENHEPDGYYGKTEHLNLIIDSVFLSGQPQDEEIVSAEEMIQADQSGSSATEAKDGIASVDGFILELVNVKLVQNIKEVGFSQEDCHVSQVADEDGMVIPDALTGTDALLLATFTIKNESAEPTDEEDYKLLSFSFQCEELIAKGITSLPDVLLFPHGPETTDGKEYNRLYLDRETVSEADDCLVLEKGEKEVLMCGILVNTGWFSRSSNARVIAFPEIDGGVAFPIP